MLHPIARLVEHFLREEKAIVGSKTVVSLHTILKVQTLDKIFNKHLIDAVNANVEGCIEIDGEDYIIKRVLTRPSLSRRTEKYQ